MALVAALCVLFIGGITFSKYITEVKGVGTASVAKWDFKVNGTEEYLQTIDLTSTSNNVTLIDNKIAPGTSGGFEINIDASEAEVGVNYKVEFLNENNLPQNLYFLYDNRRFDSILDLNGEIQDTIFANEENKQRSIMIYWDWPYETGFEEAEIKENNRKDTQDGKNGGNYTFDILVTGTQAIPQND